MKTKFSNDLGIVFRNELCNVSFNNDFGQLINIPNIYTEYADIDTKLPSETNQQNHQLISDEDQNMDPLLDSREIELPKTSNKHISLVEIDSDDEPSNPAVKPPSTDPQTSTPPTRLPTPLPTSNTVPNWVQVGGDLVGAGPVWG